MTRWSLFLQTLSLLHHFLGLYSEVGQVLTDRAFVSHSLAPQNAEIFMNGLGQGMYRRVYYQVRAPRELRATVTNVAEREVIMLPDQKFRVLRVEEIKDYPMPGTMPGKEGVRNPIMVYLEAIP